MYFDSSIPQGYGVGSSGALVAVYDKYAQNKITVLENLTREIIRIKKIFFTNESFSMVRVLD
jgi:mevalonate kinase